MRLSIKTMDHLYSAHLWSRECTLEIVANRESCEMKRFHTFSEHYESHLNGSIWISGMQNETTKLALLLWLKSLFLYLVTCFLCIGIICANWNVTSIHLTENSDKKKNFFLFIITDENAKTHFNWLDDLGWNCQPGQTNTAWINE